MNPEYEELAIELLRLNIGMLQEPAKQKIAKMTRGEFFVLNYLMTHQNQAHPAEISRSMVVSTARIAALLSRLEEKQFISRTQDPTDNRQVIVTLLPQGLALIQRIQGEVIAAVVRMLERLGPEDAREYIRIQKKILSGITIP
ncbi:MAG: MarR family transcriptional regulator [Bacillota bacterium]|nr:MarR family transcriptional regulator [Bacillota bacterium]